MLKDPNVAVVKTKDGRTQWGARESAVIQNGLADGSLKEVAGARTTNATAGDRRDTGRAGGGSGDGKRAPRSDDQSAE